MNGIEFAKKCQPLNRMYKELFGKVPSPDEYACNRDEFFEALKKSIEGKKELEKIIPVRAIRTDQRRLS